MASNEERKRLLLLEMAKARREGLLSQVQEYHQKKSGSQQLADLYSSPEYKTGLDRAYRGGMEAKIAELDAERRAREDRDYLHVQALQKEAGSWGSGRTPYGGPGERGVGYRGYQPATSPAPRPPHYPDAGGMQMGRGMSQYQVQGLLADNARSIRSREMAAQQAMAQAQAGAVAREQAGPAMSPGEQAHAIQQRAALMAQAQAGAVAREQASPAMSPGEQAYAMQQQQQQRAALTAQAQAGAVAREQAGPEMSLGEELYRQQPPTPGSTFRGMDNYAQGPTLGGRVESFGHPRVAGSGPMYPNAVPYPEASTPTATPTTTPTPTPVEDSPGESLDKFTNNYLDNVQKRKKLISGASMLFGIPDRSAEYEAKAIAKYTTLMDSRAARMSIGSQPRTQMEMVSAYLKAGGSLEGLKALSSVVTYGGSKPEAPKQLVFTETDENGKTWKVTQRWNPKTGELKEIGRVEVKEKGPLVVLNPGITEGPYATAMGTQLAKIVTDESGEAASARDSTRKIDQMIAAVQSGGVVTGQLTPMQLSIGRFFESSGIGAAAFGKFWGPQAEQIGTSEWFQAVADELGAKKLQMTKGNVTEKEMMLFLGMGPQLSKTPQGNILLLQMMQAMNARVMATHDAGNEVNRAINALADEGKSISGPKAYQMYEEIRKKKINDLDTDFENKAKRGGEWNPIRLNDEDVSGNELTESGRAKVEKGQYFILPDGRMGFEE